MIWNDIVWSGEKLHLMIYKLPIIIIWNYEIITTYKIMIYDYNENIIGNIILNYKE